MTTNEAGRADILIDVGRSHVSGYYEARASDESGGPLGQWLSIPINGDVEDLSLPLGGKAVKIRTSSYAAEGLVVTFQDWRLEAAIRGHTGLPTGPVIAPDVDHLDTLSAVGERIVDLSGLGALKSLLFLNLANNKVADLSPLSELSQLSTLYLSFNEVKDLLPLTGLSRLTTLDVSVNHVRDLSPLSQLGGLKVLKLRSLQIRDLSALQNLTELEHLDLRNNWLVDFSTFSVPATLRTLVLESNYLEDLGPLSAHDSLDELGVTPFEWTVPSWGLSLVLQTASVIFVLCLCACGADCTIPR